MCNVCTSLTRRAFLGYASKGLVMAGLASAAISLSSTAQADAKMAMLPDDALAKLMAGNEKFVGNQELCVQEIHIERELIAKGQAPWATILTCADARTPPELIFGGRNLGELFVCRNAGNVADTSVLGTVEYGVAVLGSPIIIVLGHSSCGAVAAACDVAKNGTKLPGYIGPMVEAIVPVAKSVMGMNGDFVENAVNANAKATAAKIANDSEIISGYVADGRVKVLAATYDLDTGRVQILS